MSSPAPKPLAIGTSFGLLLCASAPALAEDDRRYDTGVRFNIIGGTRSTFDVAIDAGTELVASASLGLRVRLGQRFLFEPALRLDQHFADWPKGRASNATYRTDSRRCDAHPREVTYISCRGSMPVVVLLGVIGVAACTHSTEECTAADAAQQYAQLLPVATKARDVRPDLSGCKRTGIASFYADMFTGREMADGTRMNPNADNAASRTLPLGTTAKVTNLETGQSAEVTIQDRGPYVRGRIIDLSPATAREIGLDRQDGLATVVVAPIEVPLPDGGMKRGAGDRPR